LREVASTPGELGVGAMVTHADVAGSGDIAASAPLLSRAARLIGHPAIRHRGTIGGSLAHADPAAELPAVMVALDATMDVRGPGGTRTIAAADFFESMWVTALDDGELLTGVRVPSWSGATGFDVRELTRRH